LFVLGDVCFFCGFLLFFYGSIKNTVLLLGNKEEYCWAYDRYVIVFLFFGSIENTIAPKCLGGEEA
jgi:hypothetical protein